MRTPQPFAVNGDDLTGCQLADGFYPTHKAALKLVGVELPKDTAKGIVRGDAVRQPQKFSEPFFFRFAKFRDFDPTISSTDYPTNGDCDYF